MKKTITILTILLASTIWSFGQQKQDSLIVRIEMDSAVWKQTVNLIRENINSNTESGKLLLNVILTPLFYYKLVPREKLIADKPKNIQK